MKDIETLERLERLKSELLAKHLPTAIFKKLEAIQTTIDELRNSNVGNKSLSNLRKLVEKSAHESVIIATLELIEKIGHRVTNMQIIEHLKQNGIYWGKGKSIASAVGAILYAERGRKNARIRRIGYGLWDKQREKQVLNLKLRSPEEPV